MSSEKVVCPGCGFENVSALARGRCVSCGEQLVDPISGVPLDTADRRRTLRFSPVWFVASLGTLSVLTGAVLAGLPAVFPALDFEGAAGMITAIPVWFVGGLLVGLVAPRRLLGEPVVAALLVAIPTALWLYGGQTVKVLPTFLYVLFSALGLLFALIGAHAGERIQGGSAREMPASRRS